LEILWLVYAAKAIGQKICTYSEVKLNSMTQDNLWLSAEYPCKLESGILKSITVAGYIHSADLSRLNNRLGLFGFKMCVKLFLQISISAGIAPPFFLLIS